MNEYEIRELCHEFFDAYQGRRVDVLDRIYSADCVIWHNVFGVDTTRDDNIAKMPSSYDGQRRRTYNDRVINTFEDGFVIQYSLNGVMHDGHKGALWICIVGKVKDGKITRIDEYMDSGKFGEWAGISPARAKPGFGPGAGGGAVNKDWQTIELCDRFFDAIEQKDFATLEGCYAPEAVVWHSHDNLYEPRDSNLAMLKKGLESDHKTRYRNRRIRAFEGGFVQQYRIEVTYPEHDGFVGKMDVCFVAYVRDGMISRAYEYFDTGKIAEFLPPAVLAAMAPQQT